MSAVEKLLATINRVSGCCIVVAQNTCSVTTTSTNTSATTVATATATSMKRAGEPSTFYNAGSTADAISNVTTLTTEVTSLPGSVESHESRQVKLMSLERLILYAR